MADLKDVSVSAYINNSPKNITYYGEQNGVHCYGSDDKTITIAATNENDYSIMYQEGDRYTQTYINKFRKDIYDYSASPIAYDIFNSSAFSEVNYNCDSDRNGIAEFELSNAYDNAIEKYHRNNETGKIEYFSKKAAQVQLNT